MKKIAALLTAAILVLGCVPGLAENTKHERVYVVAAPDGTVRSLTDTVRLENADALEEIADRTALTGIRNVSGREPFTQDGETLTWKAGGRDITYQGTSEKAPAAVPAVTLTLDGEEISFSDLKDKTGDAVLTVSYARKDALPALAVTVLPLPEAGVTGLVLENAALLNEMGRQVLVGWAVPGADEKLNLPASFTASFHADHADLKWMMTFCTSGPADAVLKELDSRMGADTDLHAELDEVKLLLTALQNGEALPLTAGKTKDIAAKVNALNNGLTLLSGGSSSLADGAAKLSSGAAEVKDGAKALSEGASTLASGTAEAETGAAALDEGLTRLTASSEALNAGAEALFAAALNTANEQLAASGLDAAGIALPALTAENYADVLGGALTQLDPEAVKKAAAGKAAGEAAAAGLVLAQKAFDSLSALKAQLDQVHDFAAGLKAYTDGAAGAAEGAAKLHAGMTQLSSGASALSEGAETLSKGASSLADGAVSLSAGAGTVKTGVLTLKESITAAEKEAAGKLLPFAENELTEALRMLDETRENVQSAGYDLRPEGMKADTVFIIRTDLQ